MSLTTEEETIIWRKLAEDMASTRPMEFEKDELRSAGQGVEGKLTGILGIITSGLTGQLKNALTDKEKFALLKTLIDLRYN